MMPGRLDMPTGPGHKECLVLACLCLDSLNPEIRERPPQPTNASAPHTTPLCTGSRQGASREWRDNGKLHCRQALI